MNVTLPAMIGRFIRLHSPTQPHINGQVGLVLGNFEKHMVRMPDQTVKTEYGYPVLILASRRSIVAQIANIQGIHLKEWKAPI